MITGYKLIKKERKQQIKKHGFSIQSDQVYKQEQLLQAAFFCMNLATTAFNKKIISPWPQGWSTKFKKTIEKKDRIEQLITAAAFIAAEIDRELNG